MAKLKTVQVLFCLLMFVSAGFSEASPKTHGILSWPRMSAEKFGCMLEKEFKFRDPKYNCSLKSALLYSDACNPEATKDRESYYHGPVFPASLAKLIHPNAKKVELDWEHGELRSLTIEFSSVVTEADVESYFRLPVNRSYPKDHENIQYIGLDKNNLGYIRLTVTGFEHMGAADFECDS